MKLLKAAAVLGFRELADSRVVIRRSAKGPIARVYFGGLDFYVQSNDPLLLAVTLERLAATLRTNATVAL